MLLTGASAGVGEELAYHYARLGSHLVLTAHTEAFLQKVRRRFPVEWWGREWLENWAWVQILPKIQASSVTCSK